MAAPDRYSQYTEPNYENGSYLAPVNRSYLQLCTTTDNTTEQNSNQGSPLEEIEEPSVLEEHLPFYQPDIEWRQIEGFSRGPTDRWTVQQPHGETMAVGSPRAAHSHNEDGRASPDRASYTECRKFSVDTSVIDGIDPDFKRSGSLAAELIEASDPVPAPRTTEYLATNYGPEDLADVAPIVTRKLNRQFSSVKWNNHWITYRGGDVNITEACTAVGISEWKQRSRIDRNKAYPQHGKHGIAGWYGSLEYAREVLGNAGSSLIDALRVIVES